MRYNGIVRVVSERRRFSRQPFDGTARYRYSVNQEGVALCVDVGLGGLALRTGRYLRPGTLALVTVGEEPVPLKARVAWCRGTRDHAFVAGFRVFGDDAEASMALSRLAAWASLEREGEAHLWATPTPKVVLG